MYLTMTELAKKYGEIAHLRFGLHGHIVVLTGHKIIREAFVDKGEYFANRPTFYSEYTHKGKGTVGNGHYVQ